MYNTRLLTADDIPALRELRHEGVKQYPLAFLPEPDELQRFSEAQERAIFVGRTYLGVFQSEYLIGFAGLQLNTFRRIAHRAHCGPFYVTPEHHGTGAATALMHAINSHAKDNCVSILELHVAAENTRAVQFYYKIGFEKRAQIPKAVCIDGVFYDDLLMAFEL